MEVLSLSLSRLQVLCHSLSKVLFKLSLTLLVRYRSSYSVFNFGRHIPAAWHFTPKKCYSLSTHNVVLGFLAQWANTFYGSILTWRVVFSGVCFAHWISPVPHQSQYDISATTQRVCHAIRHRVRSFFARRWLKESRLFSFPPLSNMLKFSG